MEDTLTILVVDDEVTNRMILRNMFQAEYKILEAADGEEVFSVLKNNTVVDIILLDIIMPKMNGKEVLKRLKQNPAYMKIPVVITTALGDARSECELLELGADDFIIKPYNPDIIRRRIRNISERYIYENKAMTYQLQLANEQLDALVDVLPGGVGVIEMSDLCNTRYFNDSFAELLGYPSSEIHYLMNIPFIELIYLEDRPVFFSVQKEAVKKNHMFRVAVRMKKKSGDLIWICISAKLLEKTCNCPLLYMVLTDLSEEKRVEEELDKSVQKFKYQAERDSLTGIYNRNKFYIETKKIMSVNPEEDYIIAVWNIDRFKMINDMYGNIVGDQVLKSFAETLAELFAGKGTYARMEADHFVACTTKSLLLNQIDKMETLLVFQSADVEISQPIMLHMGYYEVEDHEMPINLMCDRANIALNTVKGNYLQRYARYDDSLRKVILDEQQIINDMEKALSEEQFFINIQPIVDAKTGIMTAGEALVRWNHETLGWISPGVFVPVFEKNAFVRKLDMFVLEKVCQFLKENQKKGVRNVPISVNLSRINFYDRELCQRILDILSKYEISTELIKLEITESAYTDNPKDLLDTIEEFHKHGFRVLMDDFGSGYSSLNTLKDIPVDILKIDMAFIKSLETSERAYSILYSVIQLGKRLRMQIVAEGIETKHQRELLAGMSCDFIQGFYFSKPLSCQDFRQKLIDTELQIQKQMNEREQKSLILVIDDEKINRESMRVNLETSYEIITAASAAEGLDLLRMHIGEIRLVVSDIMMPGMDGFELLSQMKANTILSKIPVVMVTAFGEKENEVKALKMGALDVLYKPFEPESLQLRIYNILQLTGSDMLQGKNENCV